MPLRRESQLADPEKFVGVTFAMLDDKNIKRVICRATYEALCDRAAKDVNGDDWLRAWHTHERNIEIIASANYDAGKLLVDGKVVVDAHELTPLLHAKNYFQPRV
jgi:hypothetical protein